MIDEVKIDIPNNVELIIKTLEKNGFEAYAVGGCVRDVILGRNPNDWDITTSAMPSDVKNIFHKTIDTGIQHGTVTVMMDKQGYEVTTYRIDGEYEDGRHPNKVEFTSNLVEDLKRRDFTINAMAYNQKDGLVDAFDGIGDIQRRVIQCVGNPYDRFNEDALRILRAVRFAAALNFEIEANTEKAIHELAGNLSKISKERIQTEMEKLLLSDHPEKLHLAYINGITSVIFTEYDRLVENEMEDRTLYLLQNTEKDHYQRWTALLHATTRENAAVILRSLKFDNKTVDIVSRLVAAIKRPLPENLPEVRKSIYEIGEDIYQQYLEFLRVFTENIEKVNDIKKMYQSIMTRQECISLKSLAVNGRDMIELGAERGQQVGEALNMLLYKVLEDQKLNNREILINIFKDTYS